MLKTFFILRSNWSWKIRNYFCTTFFN